MSNTRIYNYHLRPEYDSENLLLEFFESGETNLLADLFDILTHFKATNTKTEDLWMNDEVLYHFESTLLGPFVMSKDVWGFVFIIAQDNQAALNKIDEYLINDNRFQKIKVDFNKYKTDKNASS